MNLYSGMKFNFFELTGGVKTAQLFPVAQDFAGVVWANVSDTDQCRAVGRIEFDYKRFWGDGLCRIRKSGIGNQEDRAFTLVNSSW